jgi:hypothetical protein
MKKSLLSAAFACAALAMPGLALADDTMSHGAMAPKMATMICRPAAAGEKPTAMMMGTEKTGMVCKPLAMDKMMKKGSGPNLSHALTAEQVDAAWRDFIQSAVSIPGGTGGG